MCKTLILATATENIMGWIDIFTSGLAKHNPEISYDLVILTFPGGFSNEAKSHLQERGIAIFEDRMDRFVIHRFSADFAENMLVYRLKHLGKAYLAHTYLQVIDASKYDVVIISDLDVLFQAPLSTLVRGIKQEKICAAEEARPLADFPFLIRKLKRARCVKEYSDVCFDCDRHEINYGFFMGHFRTIKRFLRTFLDFIFEPQMHSLLEGDTGDYHGYHEQDFLRLFLQVRRYDVVELLASEVLIHLCHRGQEDDIARLYPIVEPPSGSLSIPAVVHFAGGIWEMFPELRGFLNCYHFPDCCPEFERYFGNMAIGFDSDGRFFKVWQSSVPEDQKRFRESLYLRVSGEAEDAACLLSSIYEMDQNCLDVAYLLGMTLVEAKRIDEGWRLLRSTLDRLPNCLQMRLHVAETMKRKGDKDLALKLFHEIRAIDPKRSAWLLPVIEILVELGRQNEAKKLFHGFMNETSGRMNILDHGLCLRALGEHESALEVYSAGLKKWPSWSEIKVQIGYAQKLLHRWDEALTAFGDVLRKEPNRSYLKVEQIELLMRLDRRDEAQAVFRKLEKGNGSIVGAYQKGLCLKVLRRYEEALKSFEAASAVTSESARVHTQIGDVNLSLGRVENALLAFQRAVKADPTNIKNKYHIVSLLAKLGRFEEGTETLLAMQKEHAEEIMSEPYKYACHLKMLGRHEDAIDIFRKIDSDAPDFYNAKYQKAGSVTQIGRRYESAGCIDKAADLYNEALRDFQEVLGACPQRVDVRLSISDVYKYMQAYEKALSVIDDAQEICPEERKLGRKRETICQLMRQR
jgi:tetratricopeptide (TPR) repeat protein